MENLQGAELQTSPANVSCTLLADAGTSLWHPPFAHTFCTYTCWALIGFHLRESKAAA